MGALEVFTQSLPIIGPAVDQGFNMWRDHRDAERAEHLNNTNIEMQREFAQNGVRWKVEDAQRAGIHPLAALGAQTTSFSPVQAFTTSTPSRAFSEMGQNVERAMRAGMTEQEKLDSDLRKSETLMRIRESDMRGKLLELQIQKLQQEEHGSKGFPSDGAVMTIPDKLTSRDPRDTAKTAGDGHPLWKRFNFYKNYGIDLINSDEPNESLEGVGNLALTLMRNLVLRPAMWFDRVYSRGQQKWHTSPSNYRHAPDGLVTSPSGGR